MTSKQRTWGQFATPTDVADLLIGFCLRRPDDRLLDPACGDGALLRRAARWLTWLSDSDGFAPGLLQGIELDPETAAVAATVPGATVRQANFFTLDPAAQPTFDAIIGNPPYTRAEWIDRLDAAAGQMALFSDEVLREDQAAPRPLLPRELDLALDRRAGLYAYFFLHGHDFLREGGRLGFVVPNGWLDVAYGRALKQFLLDHFRVIAVVESAVERWFAGARINTCVIILERVGNARDRAANRVRFIRLRRPLRDLLGAAADSRRVSAVELLITRLLPAADRESAAASVRVRDQASLAAGDRWGPLLRAPELFIRSASQPTAPLGDWAIVQRGLTTGANGFFYLDRQRVEKWAIEPAFRRPLLKSLRHVDGLRLTAADCRHEVLVVPPGTDLSGTATADYLAWGEAQGVSNSATCAGRRPWYALVDQPPGALLLAKGTWRRHFCPMVEEAIAVDQQIYRILPAGNVPFDVAAALLNSAWFALACELRGRLNLGEGVLWMATYELNEITLPDPRALSDGESKALAAAFNELAARPVTETDEALADAARYALDDLVFDLVGLPANERHAARESLVDMIDSRRRRAQQIAGAVGDA